MGFCKKCGSECKTGKVCMACVNESQVDLVETITKMNWNLGTISKSLKEISESLKK